MKRARQTVGEILETHLPLATAAQVESAAERVLDRLRARTNQPVIDGPRADVDELRSSSRRTPVWIAAVAVVLLALTYAAYQMSSAFNEDMRSTGAGAANTVSSEYFSRPGWRKGLAAFFRLQKPSFEVVSIKPNNSGLSGGSIIPIGDRYTVTNITVKALIETAYHPQEGQFVRRQVFGGPDWIDSDRYDIEAKMGGDARALGPAQIQLMLQSVLEDRFQLRVHREQREMPVYNLVLVRNGPKLSEDQSEPARAGMITFGKEGEPPAPLPRGAIRLVSGPGRTRLIGNAIKASLLVTLLQGRSDRIIFDKTGLTGLFDIDMQFSQNMDAAPVPDDAAPSVFAAIQDFGMRLESGRAQLPVVVIDSVQRPSEN